MKENYIDISTSLIKNSQIIQDDRIKKNTRKFNNDGI